MLVSLNEAITVDSPYTNPFLVSDGEVKYQYLTLNSVVNENLVADHMAIYEASILLHDTKLLRSRRVYSIITLISEVSGVADILFVMMTVLI